MGFSPCTRYTSAAADPAEHPRYTPQRQPAPGTAKRSSKEDNQTAPMAPFRSKATKDTYSDLKIQNIKGRIKGRKRAFLNAYRP